MRNHDTLPAGTLSPEADLLRTVRDGDSDAFERFFASYRGPVYRVALSLLHDPMAADEVVSDVFMRAYAARGSLDPERSPLPWLHRVAVNVAISRLRTRRRGEASFDHLDGGIEPPDPRPSDVERRETAIALARCLSELSPETRSVIVLRYVLGLTIREISESTHAAPSTVRDRIRNGLRQLRESLLADVDDDRVRDRASLVSSPAPITIVASGRLP
jgi:RNA polymerase sigma-70 factor (ECF subfamily)